MMHRVVSPVALSLLVAGLWSRVSAGAISGRGSGAAQSKVHGDFAPWYTSSSFSSDDNYGDDHAPGMLERRDLKWAMQEARNDGIDLEPEYGYDDDGGRYSDDGGGGVTEGDYYNDDVTEGEYDYNDDGFYESDSHSNGAGSGSAIAAGFSNTALGDSSFVGAGEGNEALGERSMVGSGWFNAAVGMHSFIGGGEYNLASGGNSVVLAGVGNMVLGDEAVIVGGSNNTAWHDRTFVWGGTESKECRSDAPDQFKVCSVATFDAASFSSITVGSVRLDEEIFSQFQNVRLNAHGAQELQTYHSSVAMAAIIIALVSLAINIGLLLHLAPITLPPRLDSEHRGKLLLQPRALGTYAVIDSPGGDAEADLSFSIDNACQGRCVESPSGGGGGGGGGSGGRAGFSAAAGIEISQRMGNNADDDFCRVTGTGKDGALRAAKYGGHSVVL